MADAATPRDDVSEESCRDCSTPCDGCGDDRMSPWPLPAANGSGAASDDAPKPAAMAAALGLSDSFAMRDAPWRVSRDAMWRAFAAAAPHAARDFARRVYVTAAAKHVVPTLEKRAARSHEEVRVIVSSGAWDALRVLCLPYPNTNSTPLCEWEAVAGVPMPEAALDAVRAHAAKHAAATPAFAFRPSFMEHTWYSATPTIVVELISQAVAYDGSVYDACVQGRHGCDLNFEVTTAEAQAAAAMDLDALRALAATVR